ncbi:MAG: response regulator [Victivallales bacterium]
MAKILVVDDNQQIRAMLTRFFSKHGHNVVAEEKPANALVFLNDNSCDLVITDIEMPGGINGLELTKRIKDKWNIPVVVISGIADEDVETLAMIAGAEDLIKKPIELKYLLALVNSRLSRIER